jgi:hypothetical protein
MTSKESRLGFPTGVVAKSILKELYHDLTEHEVASVCVVLISHLMIEQRIDELLFKWMAQPIPFMGSDGDKEAKLHNQEVRDGVYENIKREGFARKLKLISPLARALWPREWQDIMKEMEAINQVRNKIFHSMDIKNIAFNKKLITTEDGIEEFYDNAQHILTYINDLIELITHD